MSFRIKYLKYKKKYQILKNQSGLGPVPDTNDDIEQTFRDLVNNSDINMPIDLNIVGRQQMILFNPNNE